MTPDRPDLDALGKLLTASEKVSPMPWTVLADGGPPDDLRFAAYIDDDDENCVVQPGVRLASAKLIAAAVNALPALLAYARRVEGERDVAATEGEIRRLVMLEARAELLAERDAHHATCDALAMERAEVARLRECWEDAHRVGNLRLTELNLAIAVAERLRVLVGRACDIADERTSEDSGAGADLAAIRKEAAGE